MDIKPMTQKPKIMILATISGGYAGANAVGQLHSNYPANTYILPVLCPSMFPPKFYLDSFEKGIDGILPRTGPIPGPVAVRVPEKFVGQVHAQIVRAVGVSCHDFGAM